ncbi:MAG: ABC transporter ATP-binding protein [Deltaproteobacteria bacterium]|nr:ABC transporter ATP-binding protein [Deltaproteobacteria bacterium]
MLRVHELQKSFGGFMAVTEANLAVDQGEIIAVIGPNGAGKTTLFNLITGQLKPDKGRITFKGQDIAGLPAYRVCRLGISRSFQIVNIFSRLTVFENVQVAVLAYLKRTLNLLRPVKHLAIRETKDILVNFGLMDKADRTSGSLSYGDQKVLEMAIALGNRPELLILDEPTAGMSAEETAGVIKLIHRMTADLGLTILFCEHDMEMVFSISHRIMVMQMGRTIVEGTPDEVKNNPMVQEAYLGGEEE